MPRSARCPIAMGTMGTASMPDTQRRRSSRLMTAVAAARKKAETVASRVMLWVVKPLVSGAGWLTLAIDEPSWGWPSSYCGEPGAGWICLATRSGW